MKAVTNQRKKDNIKEVVDLLAQYPIVGVVNMEGLPARNLGKMRKQLRGKCEIFMTKKRLFRLAFQQSDKDLSVLEPFLTGMPAVLVTKENPFTLFKILKKNQSPAPIKAGQIAPKDLIIPAGPTQFPPGPIIGELGQLGIKSGVENGKVAIKQDKVLVKEGAECTDQQAGFLARMGIEPMRIGLNLTAVWENGEVLPGKVLDIDEAAFMADLIGAHQNAFTLSIELGLPTKDNIETLIQRAHYDAVGLALEADVLNDATVKQVLAKAYWQAVGVAKYLPEDQRPNLPVAEAAPVTTSTTETKSADEKKDDEPEPDAGEGLGAMFG